MSVKTKIAGGGGGGRSNTALPPSAMNLPSRCEWSVGLSGRSFDSGTKHGHCGSLAAARQGTRSKVTTQSGTLIHMTPLREKRLKLRIMRTH